MTRSALPSRPGSRSRPRIARRAIARTAKVVRRSTPSSSSIMITPGARSKTAFPTGPSPACRFAGSGSAGGHVHHFGRDDPEGFCRRPFGYADAAFCCPVWRFSAELRRNLADADHGRAFRSDPQSWNLDHSRAARPAALLPPWPRASCPWPMPAMVAVRSIPACFRRVRHETPATRSADRGEGWGGFSVGHASASACATAPS